MKSGSWVRASLVLAPLALAALAVPLTVEAQEEHRVGGDEVAVYNLAGTVEIVPGAGGEVVVQVSRGGSDAQRLEVDIREVGGRQALIIRYPSDQVVYPRMGRGSTTRIRVRDDGSFFGDSGSSDSREVRLSGSGDGLEAWADLRISVPQGQEFALFLATGETDLQDLDGNILIDTGSGAVHARASSGELFIDTGSGEITVEGFRGDLGVDTGSGSVELNDVQGGEVVVDTGSGSVTGSGLAATSLEVDTGSGEIDLQAVSAPDVILDTGSGGVQVELLEDVESLVIDTGSGSVTIWVPSSVGAEVEMDTGSGGIDMDLPLEVREVKRDHVRGILGDGRGTIRVDTGSGQIRLIGR